MSLRALFDRAGRATRQSKPLVEQHFHIDADQERLLVRVRAHPRARRLRLRYDAPKQELRLTVPPRTSLASARRWVEDQQAWIAQQRAKGVPVVRVGAGTNLPWNGGLLPIIWLAERPRMPAIDGGALVVGGPGESIGARVRRWLVARARAEFAEATHAMAATAGLSCAGIAVGDPRARWGSCTSAGVIRYSWRIIMAPDYVRTALIAHEVAHLAHMNHGPEFHALVRHLCGDAHDRSREWLRQHGPMLHALRFGD